MSDTLSRAGQPTDKAKVKPNHYRKPGDTGNCVGCVVPKTSPHLSPPNDKPETEQESGWDNFVNGTKERLKDAAQWYEDNLSQPLHQFGSDAMSTGGNIATAGGVAAAAGGAMVTTGVGAAPGAVIAAGGAATAAVGGGVSAVGAGADTVATAMDSAAQWAKTGKAPDLVSQLLAQGQRILTNLVLKKVPGVGKGGAGQQAGGIGGGYVTGGGRCRLRRYKEGCPDGRTPHHVVPDHVFKQPGGGAYYPAGPKYQDGFKHADGWTVCASGKTKSSKPDGSSAKKGAFARAKDWFNSLDDHGKIHALLDPAETALGAAGNPKGTTSLGEMEAAGVAAAAKVLGCDATSMLADLRSKHQADGLPMDMKVRADPFGSMRNLNPSQMGTGAARGNHGGN